MRTPLQETASLIISSPRSPSYPSLDVINTFYISIFLYNLVNHSLLELSFASFPKFQVEHSPMFILWQTQSSSKAHQIHFIIISSTSNTAYLNNNSFSSFFPYAITSQPLHKHSHS